MGSILHPELACGDEIPIGESPDLSIAPRQPTQARVIIIYESVDHRKVVPRKKRTGPLRLRRVANR